MVHGSDVVTRHHCLDVLHLHAVDGLEGAGGGRLGVLYVTGGDALGVKAGPEQRQQLAANLPERPVTRVRRTDPPERIERAHGIA